MKLLMVIPYTPTPIRTRPYNFLRGFIRLGHQVTLATVWENQADLLALEEWRKLGVEVSAVELSKPRKLLNLLKALPTTRPLQSEYCWQPQLMTQLSQIMLKNASFGQSYAAVHVEHLRGARYGLALKALIAMLASQGQIGTKPRIVWDSVDCISLLFEKAAHSSRSLFGRWATAFDLPRTRKYEGWLVDQFDRTLVTSPADREALAQLTRLARSRAKKQALAQKTEIPIDVIPNGVDLEAFSANVGERQSATIVMTGKMSYHANITAAHFLVENVMPLVWAAYPHARVQLVGANPTAEIRALEDRYPGKVEVTGTVPDVAPYLRAATLAAAPIAYGVGIQNKVLEAMACATAVVCTPQAVSALQAHAEQDVLVAQDQQEFADKVVGLLSNQQLRNRIGDAGRAYVEKNHDWDRVVVRLAEILSGQTMPAT